MRTAVRECRSWISRTILLLMVGACFLISGCRSSQTIWSAEARSPGGKVLAIARASATGGGLSIVSSTNTTVYLRWATGSRRDTTVLQLADATDDPVNTHVDMKWLTPTHLLLTFKGNQTVVFQAIRWFDIEISAQGISAPAGNRSPVQ